MATDQPRDRTMVILLLLAVVVMPSLIIAITLAFLQFAQGLVIGELSVVELVELYLIEAVLSAIFVVVLYRLTVTLFERR